MLFLTMVVNIILIMKYPKHSSAHQYLKSLIRDNKPFCHPELAKRHTK